MSQENVEIVRRLVEAAQQADGEPAVELLHPQVELDVSQFPDGGVYRGQAEWLQFFRRWFGTWDDLEITVEDYIDVGDQVVALMRLRGRGKGSGVKIDMEPA